MKTLEQINEARNAVSKAMVIPGLSPQQYTVLCGMSVALCWVADEGGITLQNLIDGKPIAPGQTNSEMTQDKMLRHFIGSERM